eukprot:TRINITY_DN20937_c0_g2_i1.p1 TRINITY_DN20937_c0_g2~~TRINITY_DN20937_c0_g2_i1.p1  ORF type:complete len:185 (+),score=29.06 TRINITY_DN20937_c0_g2_i1:88-642(+)
MASDALGCSSCWLAIVAKMTKASQVPSGEATVADAPVEQVERNQPTNSHTLDSLATWTDIGSNVIGGAVEEDSDSSECSTTADRTNPWRPFSHAVRQGDANPLMEFERIERPGQRPMILARSLHGHAEEDDVLLELRSASEESSAQNSSSELGSSYWERASGVAMRQLLQEMSRINDELPPARP